MIKKAYHIHSTHSDGRLTIDEIVKVAIDQNIDELAICDHDTLLGSLEAYHKLNKFKTKLIPGIEISAKNWEKDIPHLNKNISLHILGYAFNLFDKNFNETIENIRTKNNAMCESIVKNLKEDGLNIDIKDIILPKNRHYYYKTDIAEQLCKISAADSINDAFYRYINNSKNVNYHTYSLSVINTVKEIKKANGIAIWAHPFDILDKTSKVRISIEEVEQILIYLIDYGIDGLEVYYEAYNQCQIRQLEKLCKKYKLKAYGGTDFHGRKEDKFVCSKWGGLK